MSFHATRVFVLTCFIFGFAATAATNAQSMADRIEYRGVMISNPEMINWGSSPFKDKLKASS